MPIKYIDAKNIFKKKNYLKIITLNEREKTINNIVSIKGYSAKNILAEIRFEPAIEAEGINFIIENTVIPASTEFLVDSDAHTTILKYDQYEIEYVEHVLSAIYGLGITNIRIHLINNNQIPFLEGSSYDYAKILLQSGIKLQNKRRLGIKILKNVIIKSNDYSYVKISPSDNNALIINAILKYDKPIGSQRISYLHSTQLYCLDLVWARTFAIHEYKNITDTKKRLPGFKIIRKNGNKEPNMIIYKGGKYLFPYRRKDEEVRHKILDFIGDISLIGYMMIGKVELICSGHKINHNISKFISSEIMKEKLKDTCPKIFRKNRFYPKYKYRSRFIKDITIPDGKILPIKSNIVKIWEIQNVGRMSWKNIYLERQGPNRGRNRIITKKRIKIRDTAPGNIVKIEAYIKTPTVPGSYYCEWKIVDQKGNTILNKQKPLTINVDVMYPLDMNNKKI